jgi:hypothetical protein
MTDPNTKLIIVPISAADLAKFERYAAMLGMTPEALAGETLAAYIECADRGLSEYAKGASAGES